MGQRDRRISGVAEVLERHGPAAMYVSLRGEVIADLAVGALKNNAILPWLSAGKPIAAVAIAQFQEKGLLGFDDPVARHVPEFARRGKEKITIRHLLTHTAGIRWAKLEKGLSWQEIIERVCDAPIEPNWVVGEKAGYHAQTSWFVLGEIVRRWSGKAWEAYAKEKIFEPAGMVNSYFAEEDSYSPAAAARGPVRELGMFYEMLLKGGESKSGARVIARDSVRVLTSRQRVGMFDHTFKQIIDWGLGFIINSARYGVETVPYGYGRHASANTFGHGGRRYCSGFGDPEHGLALAVIFAGAPGEEAHERRMREVIELLYESLGLAQAKED
jgi:CubicO group peptidase (beta-lactamase class C family)